MNIKKVLDFRLFGLTGSILMIISEFISWYTDISLFMIYVISANIAIEDAFLYLFPLISGIVCLIGSVLILRNIELKINSVIIKCIGLGFLLLFFVEFIPNEIVYLANAKIGFYFCVAGFLLVIIDVVNILMLKE